MIVSEKGKRKSEKEENVNQQQKLSLEEGSGEKLGLGMADTGCECVHFFRSSHSSAAGERRVGTG